MSKNIIKIFTIAFVLNWVWEIAHSVLYSNYQGGNISAFILFRATIADALILLTLILIAQKFKTHNTSIVIIGGLIIATLIELWALQTGRWAYNSLMPIIPIIKIGFTPFIQLAITGYITHKILK